MGYCSETRDFKLMVEGEPFELMLDDPLDDEEQDGRNQDLYRTTQDHDFASKIKRSIFNVALGEANEEEAIIVTYNEKIRRFESQIDKIKTIVKGKKLSDPGLFPVTIIHLRRGWKVQIYLPVVSRDEKGKAKPSTQFLCSINGRPYDDYIYKFIDPNDKEDKII